MSADDRNDETEDTLNDLDRDASSSEETKGDGVEETLQWAVPSDQTTTDLPPTNTEATRVFAGGAAANKTVSNLNEETKDAMPASVMHSRDICAPRSSGPSPNQNCRFVSATLPSRRATPIHRRTIV